MTREELIEVAAKAIAAQGFWDDLVCAELSIDAVEPLIRADEQERERGRRIDRYDTTTIQEIVSDERERLRAGVSSLRAKVRVVHDEERPTASEGALGAYDAVLALFDGGSDG